MKITPELAEFLGILIGDGYFDIKRNRFIITGNLWKDADYLENYVKRLIEKLFELKTVSWKQEHKGAIYLCINSKKLIEELKNFDLSKDRIPNIIIKSDKTVKASFLRGLADTDFAIYLKKRTYPIICATFKNETLANQIKIVLNEFGIRANIYFQKRKINNKIYDQYDIQIYGKKNLERWLQNIGFRNKRLLNKVESCKSKVLIA